ncbi:MAG: hypothetical protein HP493_01335 [Nitrospira sp.]|nr:hypothetical protein [Nitrospira sp.]
MYRRNITHILIPMALALALVVGYNLFLKTPAATQRASTASAVGDTIEPVSPPPPPAAIPREVHTAQVRVLDHPAIPGSPHEALLIAIRDEIEKHNLPLAETKLLALSQSVISDATTKPFVAMLWNNLGLEQETLYGTQLSVKAFKKAAALDSSNPVILLNLAHAYWEQRDPALNRDLLEQLIRLAPEEPFPHLAMAELLHEQHQSSEAVKHLARAADRLPRDPALRSYLAAVTAKVQHMESVESRMTAKMSEHFMVKFDGAEDHGTWTAVLEILEEAYREIGQKFGHFPSKPIVVVLHTKDSFQGATGSPAWADGLFDPTLGRIQLPTQGATTDTKWLTSVLRHEYVHALLHDRLGHQRSKPCTLAESVTSTPRANVTATNSSVISVSSTNPDSRSSARYFDTAGWRKYLACLATSSVPKSSGVPSDISAITSSIATPYWHSTVPCGLTSKTHPSDPRSMTSGPPGSNS